MLLRQSWVRWVIWVRGAPSPTMASSDTASANRGKISKKNFEEPLAVLTGHHSDINSLDFAPNDVLLTGSRYVTYDARLFTLKVAKKHWQLTTIFCSDQHVQIWNLCGVDDSTSKLSDPRTLHCHKYGINHVQVSPMGTMFATGSTDGTTSLWDLKVSQDSSIFVQFSG